MRHGAAPRPGAPISQNRHAISLIAGHGRRSSARRFGELAPSVQPDGRITDRPTVRDPPLPHASSSPTSTWARAAARPSCCSTSSATWSATRLYLVGDIVDGWKLKSGWYWPQAHNDVVQKILRLARKGVDGRSTSPATTTRWSATSAASTSAAWWWPATRSTRPPTAAASWSPTATSSTGWCSTPGGWPSWATGPTARCWRSTPCSTACAAGWASATGASRPS